LDSKILILLPIWGREKIVDICFDNLKELQKEYNIEVLCVVSEQWAKIKAFKYGFKQVWASNECLGTKMNIGVKEALEYDFDYMMNLGSDDIITKKLLEIYKPFMQDGRAIFGSTKVAFIDSVGKEIKHFDYGILIGAGRMIKKSVLKECVYKNGEVDMYDKIQCGLDLNSLKRFKKYSHTELDNGFDTIFDIKSDTNIWKYTDLKGETQNFDTATKELTTKQLDAILEL